MQHPGTPGAGISGAQKRWLLGGTTDSCIPQPGPCWQRLHRVLRLQHANEHLHRCGPRPVGEFIAELLDQHGISPPALDRLLDWRALDPVLVTSVGGAHFPRVALLEVPRS